MERQHKAAELGWGFPKGLVAVCRLRGTRCYTSAPNQQSIMDSAGTGIGMSGGFEYLTWKLHGRCEVDYAIVYI